MGIFNVFTRAQEVEKRAEPREEREILFNQMAYTLSLDRSYTTRVTAEDALSVSALNKGISTIAEVFSSLPLHEQVDDIKIEPSAIIRQPNPEESRKQTLFSWALDYLLYGNMFGIFTDFDELNIPRVLVPVPACEVGVRKNGGIITYTVNGDEISRNKMFHVKWQFLPGDLIGKGVLEVGARTIQHALAANKRSYLALSKSSVPQIVIENPQAMDAEEKRAFHEAWTNKYENNPGLPAILDGGMSAKEYGYNSQEQQLIETRQQLINDIAGHLNIDAYWCNGSTDNNTYNNNVDRFDALLTSTILPICDRVEAELSRVLPEGHRAKFNPDAILRVNPLDQAKTFALGVNKWITSNEIRALKDLPPIEGGDEFASAPSPAVNPLGDNSNDNN